MLVLTSPLISASISVLDNLGNMYSPKLVTNSIALAGLVLPTSSIQS